MLFRSMINLAFIAGFGDKVKALSFEKLLNSMVAAKESERLYKEVELDYEVNFANDCLKDQNWIESFIKFRNAAPNGQPSWYGIPYGAAPTGESRWTAPQEPARWLTVRDCTSPAPAAYQYTTFPLGTERSEEHTSELQSHA